MKVAAGVHIPDRGRVAMDGRSPTTPADAIRLGVSLVRQELIQAGDLDVGQNVLLGHEPHRYFVVDRPELYELAQGRADPSRRRHRSVRHAVLAVARPEASASRSRALSR